MTIRYLIGDALEQVATLDDNSIDLVATSPPFLALRNYNDLDGQWGSEPSPAMFLDNLLDLVEAIGPKLAEHGSIAVELGDTFAGSSVGWTAEHDSPDHRTPGRQRHKHAGTNRENSKSGSGWPQAKSLCGIPTLFAWSLAYGRNLLNPDHEIAPWRIRNVIVWARNNPPVGALGDKVRPATSYITVATRSDKRWFDLDAVRTEAVTGDRVMWQSAGRVGLGEARDDGNGGRFMANNPAGAPPLDHWHDEYDGDHTWLINTIGSSLAHYAMWPATLAERLILSMCPGEVCRQCGQPRRRITERSERYAKIRSDVGDFNRNRSNGIDDLVAGAVNNRSRDMGRLTSAENITVGWSDCGHGDYRPGTVLDPFAGSGTTLAVADIHDRDAIGIDLDPANEQLLPERYAECWRTLKPNAGTSPVNEHGQQGQLL